MQDSSDLLLDAFITTDRETADLLVKDLSQIPTLRPDPVASAGIEGGGDHLDILLSLGKAAIGPLASVLSKMSVRHNVSVTVGETKIDVTSLKREDIEGLISAAFETERRRSELSKTN